MISLVLAPSAVGQVRPPGWRQTSLFVGAAVLIDSSWLDVAFDVYLHNLLVEEGSRSARNLSYDLSARRIDRCSPFCRLFPRSSNACNATASARRALWNSQTAPRTSRRRYAIASRRPVARRRLHRRADGKIGDPDRAKLVSVADLHGQDHLDSLRDASADTSMCRRRSKARLRTWQLSLSKRVAASDGSFLAW